MEITIYTSTGCVWCERMKELMTRANQEYTEILWQELTAAEQKEFGNQWKDHENFNGSFPCAFIDGELVGGLVPVAKKFMADGLVSAPQK